MRETPTKSFRLKFTDQATLSRAESLPALRQPAKAGGICFIVENISFLYRNKYLSIPNKSFSFLNLQEVRTSSDQDG